MCTHTIRPEAAIPFGRKKLFKTIFFKIAWFRNKLGIDLVRVRIGVWNRVSVNKTVALLRLVTLRLACVAGV
jgi:hypothetical protein